MHFLHLFLTFAQNQYVMGKEKLTKKGICVALASKIHITNLSEKEILNTLYGLWILAWVEGYKTKGDERNKFKTSREATHKKEWGETMDKIEDIVNGGTKLTTKA